MSSQLIIVGAPDEGGAQSSDPTTKIVKGAPQEALLSSALDAQPVTPQWQTIGLQAFGFPPVFGPGSRDGTGDPVTDALNAIRKYYKQDKFLSGGTNWTDSQDHLTNYPSTTNPFDNGVPSQSHLFNDRHLNPESHSSDEFDFSGAILSLQQALNAVDFSRLWAGNLVVTTDPRAGDGKLNGFAWNQFVAIQCFHGSDGVDGVFVNTPGTAFDPNSSFTIDSVEQVRAQRGALSLDGRILPMCGITSIGGKIVARNTKFQPAGGQETTIKITRFQLRPLIPHVITVVETVDGLVAVGPGGQFFREVQTVFLNALQIYEPPYASRRDFPFLTKAMPNGARIAVNNMSIAILVDQTLEEYVASQGGAGNNVYKIDSWQ